MKVKPIAKSRMARFERELRGLVWGSAATVGADVSYMSMAALCSRATLHSRKLNPGNLKADELFRLCQALNIPAAEVGKVFGGDRPC